MKARRKNKNSSQNENKFKPSKRDYIRRNGKRFHCQSKTILVQDCLRFQKLFSTLTQVTILMDQTEKEALYKMTKILYFHKKFNFITYFIIKLLFYNQCVLRNDLPIASPISCKNNRYRMHK